MLPKTRAGVVGFSGSIAWNVPNHHRDRCGCRNRVVRNSLWHTRGWSFLDTAIYIIYISWSDLRWAEIHKGFVKNRMKFIYGWVLKLQKLSEMAAIASLASVHVWASICAAGKILTPPEWKVTVGNGWRMMEFSLNLRNFLYIKSTKL